MKSQNALYCLIFALLSLLGLRASAQQVVFSEIMYNPPGELPEYIEVLNNTATPYDIANWQLSGGVTYDFPSFDNSEPLLTFLKAFERILISSVSEEALREAYPSIPDDIRIFGPWDGLSEDGTRLEGKLSNAGERITLKNKNGSLHCSFAYDDDPAFWPVAADEAGHSLQVINSNRKIDDWRNWRASTQHGGSPGTADAGEVAASPVTLSEVFIDEENKLAWVEIHNAGPGAANLSGLKFVVPGSTTDEQGLPVDATDENVLSGSVPEGGYLSLDTNFTLEDDNVVLLITNADNNVLSAHRIGNARLATAYQTYPAGSTEWYANETPSKNAANDPQRFDQIVINEIMFSHPVGISGEFIELYNNSDDAVDLSGWEITDGVRYEFPNGTTIEPRGYIVVAADTVWCQENYESMTDPLGDFELGLSNQGETIRMVDASGNLVDQVSYGIGGEWPELADGLGSSLELVHPDLDNDRGSAWRDSDEGEKSEMREYSATLRYNSQSVWHPTNDDELHLHLVGEGYLVLKDVNFARPKSLFNPDSTNLLENSDQESVNSKSNTGWVFQGTHATGFYKDGEVHIRATGRGDNRANRVEIDTGGLGSSTDLTLSFQARWIYGKPRLIAQTSDHAWSHEFLIEIPTDLGTPGAANTQSLESAPPQVDSLNHSPAVPRAGEDVVVTAHVSAPDGLESVKVAFIDDSAGGNEESLFRRWNREDMNDEGTGSDAVAGDGIYTGVIDKLNDDGTIIAFYIEAKSKGGEEFHYPQGGSNRPAFYVIDNQEPDFELRTVRAVVGQYDLGAISGGSGSKYESKYPRSSNQYWNSTVIYNESEIYYNAIIRSAGSPFHTGERGNLGLKGKWKMPKSKAFRNRIKTTYDQDPTSGRAHNDRVIRHWLYLLGHKVNDNEFIKFTVNDGRWATREEVETPGSTDFMRRLWGEDGHQGHMYRIDDEWDFGDNLDNQRNSKNAEWNYKSPNGHRAGRYHSEYMLRSREVEYDFSALIDGFRILTETDYTQEDAARHFDIQMIAMNAAARGYIHDWDFQTLNRGKNTFFFRRPDGFFQYVHWDSDLAFRPGDVNAAFINGQGSTLRNFMRKPWFQRWLKYYLWQLDDKYVDGSARFETWLDLEDNSTSDQGCDVNRYISWGERRRGRVRTELGDDRSATFAITSNGGNDFSTEEHILTLEGTSAVDAYEVFVEDHPEAEIYWTGTVEYEMRGIVLKEGENVLNVRARDENGNVLGSLFSPKRDSITVTKTTPSEPIPGLDMSPASLNVALGQNLRIDASSSWDPEGDALNYAFSAPNGAAVSADGPVAELVFDQPGVYPVTISISDSNGNTAEVVREVAVFGGQQGFEKFSNRRLSNVWRTENLEAASTRYQSNFYALGDPDGTLSMVVTADDEKPLATEGTHPALVRDLPPESDFTLQSKLFLANVQFGPFQSGILADFETGGASTRYAFGVNEGNRLSILEVIGEKANELTSIDRNERSSTVRIRRQGNQLHFDYRESDEWHRVHSLDLADGMIAKQGGLFTATDEAMSIRVRYDYAMLIDSGQISSLQEDLRLTEVMYNPAGNEDLEFLEMQNVGASTLDLDGVHFTDGIEYTFTDVQLGPGQFIILAKDAALFTEHYGATQAQVVGGYGGRLSNGGETLELVDRDELLIFSFTYGDGEPWPTAADGEGNSLEVVDTSGSLNDAGNWQASAAADGSPGTGGEVVEPDPGDTDGDGMPNAWETANGLNPNDASDAQGDADLDGSFNFGEFLANTDPQDPASVLRLRVATLDGEMLSLSFDQQPERAYTIEASDDLQSWEVFKEIAPGEDNVENDSFLETDGERYYRLRVSLP